PTDSAVAELAAARQEVGELARHTQLITACLANQRTFAEELNSDSGDLPVRAQLTRRHRQALREFGLDVVEVELDEVAKAVAESLLRDALLGMFLEWYINEAYVLKQWQELKKEEKQLSERIRQKLRELPAPEPVVKDHLEQVIRASRRLCGGAYARWQ